MVGHTVFFSLICHVDTSLLEMLQYVLLSRDDILAVVAGKVEIMTSWWYSVLGEARQTDFVYMSNSTGI